MSDPRDKSSDYYADDPIIVFDQNEDDSEGNSQTPIGFGFRQPSFVRLHGVPIPKGFGSLADFKAEKLPVKVERFIDKATPTANNNPTAQSIRELLRRRNAQKWEEMGYDPNIIEKSLGRKTSHTVFVQNKPSFTIKNPSNSFANIDSLKILNGNPKGSTLEPVSEENKVTNTTNNRKKLTRSLSSGKTLPSIEMPNNSQSLFHTELFKGCNSNFSSDDDDDEEIVVEEDIVDNSNIPPNLRPFITHNQDTFTYRALEGENLRDLQESAKELIINDLDYYLEVAIDNGLVSEICYLQVIIENLKKDNNTQSIQEMSELDYRIYETSIDIEDYLKLWKQEELKIISEKNKNMQILDRRFADVSSKAKQQSQISSIFSGTENKEQTAFNNYDSQAQMQKLSKLYQTEKMAIINNYNSKMNSLNSQKEQALSSLSQRLLLLKRQKEELLNEQQKNNSQSDLLKPKAASSRQNPPYFACKQFTVPFKMNIIQEDPKFLVHRQGLRPRTPGGPIICKPKTQKYTDTNF